ncbi:MAG: hypothetical protein LM564_01995 [Desulfurococcaceae archaeon]|nr:hypothetical protein [Desulfurococcaceae archaeon]
MARVSIHGWEKMIARISVNYERMIAQSTCGEKADHYYDVIIYSADGRPMFTAKACEVDVNGLPVSPETVVLVEAVLVTIEKGRVHIYTPALVRNEGK